MALMTPLEQIDRILLPQERWDEIVTHCKRKLAGDFLPGESKVRRAYGILAGSQNKREIFIDRVLPVKKNARDIEPLKTYMDTVMAEYAKPSKTPMSKRGWITDPLELKACYDQCDQENLQIFGTYHMHIVPWEGDPIRDTPTLLDTVLARNSNLFSFIISMVDISRPSIKAFFEGKKEQEVPMIIKE
jgi:hypothetical protein